MSGGRVRVVAVTLAVVVAIVAVGALGWQSTVRGQHRDAQALSAVFDRMPIPEGFEEDRASRFVGPFGWAGVVCLSFRGCPYERRVYVSSEQDALAAFTDLVRVLAPSVDRENVRLTCYEDSTPACVYAADAVIAGARVDVSLGLVKEVTGSRLLVTLVPLDAQD